MGYIISTVPGQTLSWVDLQEIFLALSQTLGNYEFGDLGFEVWEKGARPAWLAIGTVTNLRFPGGGDGNVS